MTKGSSARLFDRPFPPGYPGPWAGHGAPEAAPAGGLLSLFLFRLGAEWLALPTAVLREAAPLLPIAPIPHRRGGAVLGVVNVRGELVVCLSLARLLGVAPGGEGAVPLRNRDVPRFLVVGGEGGEGPGRLAFPVDAAHGLLRHPAADLGAVPATVSGAAAPLTRAVFAWEGRSVGLLDAPRLLAALERSLA